MKASSSSVVLGMLVASVVHDADAYGHCAMQEVWNRTVFDLIWNRTAAAAPLREDDCTKYAGSDVRKCAEAAARGCIFSMEKMECHSASEAPPARNRTAEAELREDSCTTHAGSDETKCVDGASTGCVFNKEWSLCHSEALPIQNRTAAAELGEDGCTKYAGSNEAKCAAAAAKGCVFSLEMNACHSASAETTRVRDRTAAPKSRDGGSLRGRNGDRCMMNFGRDRSACEAAGCHFVPGDLQLCMMADRVEKLSKDRCLCLLADSGAGEKVCFGTLSWERMPVDEDDQGSAASTERSLSRKSAKVSSFMPQASVLLALVSGLGTIAVKTD